MSEDSSATLAATPLANTPRPARLPSGAGPLERELASFREFGRTTLVRSTPVALPSGARSSVPTFVNEFWTSRQRMASSLHEISYRACFKPQLPRFFLERLTEPGEVVYDPFMGRGTTLLEAALLGRVPWGCDANPLSACLLRPRLAPPTWEEVSERLGQIDLGFDGTPPRDLRAFYHPRTLAEVCALRAYLRQRERRGSLDLADDWIRMVALNRLTGHSPGFLSVYTLPPNQAVSAAAQRKINAERGQRPPRRQLVPTLLKKTQALLRDVSPEVRRTLRHVRGKTRLLSRSSETTPELPSGKVALVVTSPPFLDVVDYPADNWLRAWFAGISLDEVAWTLPPDLPTWESAMTRTFAELRRLLRPGGHVAFEVGEVHRGRLSLEESVVRCGTDAGLDPRLLLVQEQAFTKTSHCWGVDNGRKGTNSHRVVLFRKDG